MHLSSERAASLRLAFTLTGATLLVLGELTDLLEYDLGLNWLNVAFALPLAVIAILGVAVGGDVLLEALERRRGRRPARGLATPMLAGLGLGTAIEIALHHVRQPPHLDAWLGLAGGALLIVAAGLGRYDSAPVKSNLSGPSATPRRARPSAVGGSRQRRLMRTRRRAVNRSTTPN